MAVQKRHKVSQEALRLKGRYGEKVAKEIVERRKLQINKFDRVTQGLTKEEIDDVQKRGAKSRVGRKLEKERDGKRVEDPKKAYLCKGNKCAEELTKLMRSFAQRRGVLGKSELRRNKKGLHPLDDDNYILNLLRKHDSQIGVMASSSKKRPRRLVFNRTYNREILDTAEFSVSDIKNEVSHFEHGTKPIVLTMGSLWKGRFEMDTIRSLLVDFFHGFTPDKMYATAIDRLVVLTAIPSDKDEVDPVPQVMCKEYKIIYENNGSSIPFVNLSECGFSFVLSLDRLRVADADLFAKTLRVPREEHTEVSRALEGKGVTKNEFGDVLQKIFFKNETENLVKLFTPATRILKRTIPEGKLRTPDKAQNTTRSYPD